MEGVDKGRHTSCKTRVAQGNSDHEIVTTNRRLLLCLAEVQPCKPYSLRDNLEGEYSQRATLCSRAP